MQVLLLPMLKPRSYTREDVVELHCHGGSVCVQRVLSLCLVRAPRRAPASLRAHSQLYAACRGAPCVARRVHHARIHERCVHVSACVGDALC